MYRARTSVLVVIIVAFLTVSLVKGDCANCCLGKWHQCMGGCSTMNECTECSTKKESCAAGCPHSAGSCSVNYGGSSLRRPKIHKPKKLKLRRKIKKMLKRLERERFS